WLQGRHYVDVRARKVGRPGSLDRTPARVALLVDTVAPAGTFDVAGAELEVAASDLVTPASALQIRYRRDDGASLSPWLPLGRVALPRGAATAGLRVQARDEAGNIGELLPISATGSGCSFGGGDLGRGDGNLGLLLFALVGLVRRRWRKTRAIGTLLLFCG